MTYYKDEYDNEFIHSYDNNGNLLQSIDKYDNSTIKSNKYDSNGKLIYHKSNIDNYSCEYKYDDYGDIEYMIETYDCDTDREKTVSTKYVYY